MDNPAKAPEDLPDWAVIPRTLVVSSESADLIARMLAHPPKPTEALRRLMRGVASEPVENPFTELGDDAAR